MCVLAVIAWFSLFFFMVKKAEEEEARWAAEDRSDAFRDVVSLKIHTRKEGMTKDGWFLD